MITCHGRPVMLEDPHGLSGGSVCPEPHNCVVKNIKVAVFGKTGVGKTATIAKLCGKGKRRLAAALT